MNSLSFSGSSLTFGNITYVLLFGWWISLFYCLICPVMYLTIFGAPYGTYLIKLLFLLKCLFFFVANKIPSFSLFAGKLCSKMALYFIWPFGKSLNKVVPLFFFFLMYLFENFIHSIKLLYSLKIPKSNHLVYFKVISVLSRLLM